MTTTRMSSIYLTLEQQNVINAVRMLLSKDIEKQRNPKEVYKGSAFEMTPNEIIISFVLIIIFVYVKERYQLFWLKLKLKINQLL